MRYSVHNMAGGTELTTRDLERAVLHALRRCPLGPGYVLDASGAKVDLGRWQLEFDEEGGAYLTER